MADWFTRIAAQRLAPTQPLRPALLPALAPRRPGLAIATFDVEPGDEAAFEARDARRTDPLAVSPPVSLPNAQRATLADASASATSAAKSAPIAAQAGFKEPGAITARNDVSRIEPNARPARPSSSLPDASTTDRRIAIEDERPRTSAAVSATATPTLARCASPLATDRAAALRPADLVASTARAPVVHVHIERLEVRAPATPARPAPALRSRAKSADTLADYLRAGARR